MFAKRQIFALLTLLWFFAAQGLVIGHTSEFGAGKHEHKGQLCDIYVFAEHAKSTTLADAVTIQPPAISAATEPTFFFVSIAGEIHRHASPRAPPALS